MAAKSQAMALLTSKNSNEWYTPPDIIERARTALGGIELDPCTARAPQAWIKAERYYTLENPVNPEAHDLTAKTAWCNPPFDNTAAWVNLLSSKVQEGRINRAIMLVNNAAGYAWFERAWRLWPIISLEKRLHFIEAESGVPAAAAAKKAQVLIYMQLFNANPRVGEHYYTPFVNAFGSLGKLILP